MKSISNHKLFAGFALALALLVGVAVVNWRHLARMEETAALVAHTERVRDELQGLLLTVVDVETAMRGFVLTGEPDFLKPLEDGVQRVSDEQRVLESLIIDGKQKASLDLLQPLVTTRIASAQALVETHRKFGAEAALKEIFTQKGKRLTDQIRGQIARMDARAGALVEQQSAAAKTAARETRVLMATGLSMSVVLLITVFAGARRENRLRQQAEAQRDRFFDLSLDLLCIAGTDGYYKQLSPAFSQTLGWSGEEILERPYLDFVHPDDRAATLAEVEKLTHGVPSILFENRYQCKDGSWKWLSWRAQPFPSEGLLYATARDVTEHKQAGERVEQDDDISLQLDHPLGLFQNDFRHVNMFFGRFVERAGDDLGIRADDQSLHFRHFFGTLVDEQHEDVTFRVILQNGVGHLRE